MTLHAERIIVMRFGYQQQIMNPGTTYIKTDKGRAEMAGRSHVLNALQRRVLILIDGKKTVGDLLGFVRVGELDAALGHLQQGGLIESTDYTAPLQVPAAPGFAAADPSRAPRPATSPEEYKYVRQQASDFVSKQL